MKQRIGIGLAFAMAAVVLVAIYAEYRHCAESGGRLVRGVVWFECVP